MRDLGSEYFSRSPIGRHFVEETIDFSNGFCSFDLPSEINVHFCKCPAGRFGLGCMPLITPAGRDVFSRQSSSSTKKPSIQWTVHSMLLAWSNLAFVPVFLLALKRRLWIPAIAYSYTCIVSIVSCRNFAREVPLVTFAEAIKYFI
ncbi:Transmembrane protein 8B [Cichlidogyrus casuarinus]|uniref:Transmembrane protein 8B n=1 Tax=Cichlidogyrus casuarinus TaxID=1844966 RepID=A0ABD2Q4Y9_9PLAT